VTGTIGRPSADMLGPLSESRGGRVVQETHSKVPLINSNIFFMRFSLELILE